MTGTRGAVRALVVLVVVVAQFVGLDDEPGVDLSPYVHDAGESAYYVPASLGVKRITSDLALNDDADLHPPALGAAQVTFRNGVVTSIAITS